MAKSDRPARPPDLPAISCADWARQFPDLPVEAGAAFVAQRGREWHTRPEWDALWQAWIRQPLG